jgi:hypothetical protein
MTDTCGEQSATRTITASLIRVGQDRVYRCDECRALLADAEDARAHIWWHGTVLHARTP